MSTENFEQASPVESIPGEVQGYSDYWRVNKHYNEPFELASVLRALRKITGYIGMNVGTVTWAGMSTKIPPNVIAVNPAFVYGTYPVPAGKMDILIGAVVHEAMHQREWSDFVWREVENALPDADIKVKDILKKMVDAGEDIYIDLLSRKNVTGLYVRKAHEYIYHRPVVNPSRPPSIEVLFDLWRWLMIKGSRIDGSVEPYRPVLTVLRSRMIEMIEKCGSVSSVQERAKMRAHFYIEMWEEIGKQILSWRVNRITYLSGEIGPEKRQKSHKIISGRNHVMMSGELASHIEQLISHGTRDLTPRIIEICGSSQDVLPTILWDSDTPAGLNADPYLVARLKMIFQAYANRVKIKNRGLSAGKIDSSRLYRAGLKGNCFFEWQAKAVPMWDFMILVDASMSMRGHKWRLVKNTAAALHKAIEGSGNMLNVLAYNEHDEVVVISRLLKQKKLYSITPAGRTPSGQAIIAAALQMPDERKKKLIIHITDGESNCGCSLEHAFNYCKKEKIDLVTLGCGYKEKDALIKQYGKSLQFIDYFEQLPSAMENLFIRKLLLHN